MFYNWGTKTKTLAAFIILAIFEYEGPWKRCKLCWKLLHCNTVMLQQNIDVWLSPPPPHIVWWRGRDCEEAIEIMLKGTAHVMDRSLFLTWTGTWVICIIGEWLGKPGKWQFFLWKKKKTSKQGVADPGAGQDSKTYCENWFQWEYCIFVHFNRQVISYLVCSEIRLRLSQYPILSDI